MGNAHSLRERSALSDRPKYPTIRATQSRIFSLINLKGSKQMSIESAIEQKIKEAMARGEFDNLSGSGKPLDLEAYFNTPEDLRMSFSMLKSNDFVPEEVEIFKEIAELKERLSAIEDESEKNDLRKRLDERTLVLSLLLDKRRRR